MLTSRCSLFTAALMLAGCTGVVQPKNSAQSDTDNVNANESRDAGRDARTRDASSKSNQASDDDVESDDESNDDDDVAASDDESADVKDAGKDSVVSTGCSKSQGLPLAQGLHIRELALYQTVKIPLLSEGTWVGQRVAPVVQNKKSLVRVFVDPLTGYRPHVVRAVLTLVNGGTPLELTDERTVSAASTDAQLGSTFSFQVDPTLIGDDTELSLSLVETNCGAADGDAEDVRFPSTGGTQALDATRINKLEVVVVPVNVGGRVPVTTADEVKTMREALLAYYPVPEVDITVRSPLIWGETVDPQDGNSWSDLLNQIMRERRSDSPASNVYYFGLVQPASTFRAYCQRGCVLGLAPQTATVQPSAQVGLGASFADLQTYETMVHELGHAHGRGHAPCVEGGSIDGVDPAFPDKTGATGAWGWDSRTNTLMPPTDKDIMGYCEPNWISVYNYKAIAARSLDVNLKALRISSGISWQNVTLYDDGRARWGGDLLREDPAGEYEAADVLDAAGNVIDQIEVVRLGLSHAGAQFLYLPQPGAQWDALRLQDRVLKLADVLPAL